MPRRASSRATSAPIRFAPVTSAARPVRSIRSGLDSADEDDAEPQRAGGAIAAGDRNLDDERLVTELGGVHGKRRVARRRRIDAPDRRMRAADRLLGEIDRPVVTARRGVGVCPGGAKEEELAERRNAEVIAV